MNLRAQISDELWQRVRSSYEAEHYTHAVRDAMVFVTEALRDKSGLDGDGRNLVNAALGFGKSNKPRIQVNKLETETERDIQNGLREVLSGMYALVRNPRTHEHVNDDKKTADIIICFIDHLLSYLGKSKSAYTIDNFVSRVNDRYFVQEKEYVLALISSIPVRKRSDTIVALFREAAQGSLSLVKNSTMVLEELIREASSAEIDHLLNVVSASLEEATESSDVSRVIRLIPAHYWPKLGQVARWRAENILIEELRNAMYMPDTDRTNAPSATWLTDIIFYMSLRKNLGSALLKLLRHDNPLHGNFVAQFFFDELPSIFETDFEVFVCTFAIAGSITRGNEFVERCLHNSVQSFPESWYAQLAQALKPLTDPEAPKWYLPDGTPVLTRSDDEEEDDIPF